MTPANRAAAFEASLVTDLGQLAAEYLAGLHADAEDLIARRDAAATDAGLSAQHAS